MRRLPDSQKGPITVYRCDHCGRVVAELRDGKLVLVQHHGNGFHQTIICLPAQVELTAGNSQER